MNFFEQQDRARKKTGLLIFLFALSVAFLIFATCLLVFATLAYTQAPTEQSALALTEPSLLQFWSLLPADLLLTITFSIIGIVGLGSLYKMAQLSSGGETVANMLGGRLLNTLTRNANEKKLLNVVEEMAIASGMPVPPVYLLDEQGINAFAAGTQPSNAVIGITQGAIEQLSRDELQGVIAHEFSHIFNGDMRMNIRLIGVLNGILIFGLAGYMLLRVSSRGGMRSSRNNNSTLPFLVLGAGLMVIGYGGTFFGNLIKSAVSRQREFLADASAVQFTRNPSGIGSALKKIGGFSQGSIIEHPNGQEISHLFFGQSSSFFLNRLFATHPPLEERIQRIDQSWSESSNSTTTSAVFQQNSTTGMTSGFSDNLNTTAHNQLTANQLAESVNNNIGEVSPVHKIYAQQFISTLPDTVKQAAHEPYGASALTYCLLLDSNSSVREKQLQGLRTNVDSIMFGMITMLYLDIAGKEDQTLALLDLLLPTLKQLSAAQHSAFKQNLLTLIHADNKVELFEWSLFSIVRKQLEANKPYREKIRPVKNIKLLGRPIMVVLSAVAYTGAYESLHETTQHSTAQQESNTQKSFSAAIKILGMPHLPLLPRQDICIKRFSKALQQLENLYPLQKPRLLKAIAHAIMHDGKIKPLEAQLFRAITQCLDCPAPPLVGNIK